MNVTYPLRALRGSGGSNGAPAVSVRRAIASAWALLKQLTPSQARAQLLQMADMQAAERPELAAQLRKAAASEWL